MRDREMTKSWRKSASFTECRLDTLEDNAIAANTHKDMKKKNHIAIGAFVVGAIFLTVLSIMLFGSGDIFQSRIIYTTSFDTSVNGLSKGSDVLFRGIKIGEVTDIQLSFDRPSVTYPKGKPHSNNWPIVVSITLFPNSVAFNENRDLSLAEKLSRRFLPGQTEMAMENWISDMVINRGLRAQLETQSMLTGMLYIDLDFYQPELSTTELTSLIAKHIIPSRLSSVDSLFQMLNETDITNQFRKLMAGAEKFGNFLTDGSADTLMKNLLDISNSLSASGQDIKVITSDFRKQDTAKLFRNINELAEEINNSAKGMRAIIDKVNQQKTYDMLDDAAEFVDNSNATVKYIRGVVIPKDKPAKPSPNLDETLHSLKNTLDKVALLSDTLQHDLKDVLDNANKGLKMANQQMQPDSPTMSNINGALEDIRQASQSIRALADLLTNNPEAIIRGRKD